MTDPHSESDPKHAILEAPKEEAIASITTLGEIQASTNDFPTYDPIAHQRLPRPSKRRLLESLTERPFDLEAPPDTPLHEIGGGPEAPRTVFYLAYGSNLCRETFQGRRGIKPISAVNVVVPELVMTFDLAGIPYTEPCFANTRYRTSNPTITLSTPVLPSVADEKHPQYPASTTLIDPLTPDLQKKYHNPYWPKGLVGVVYEVTLGDFAHIIATEGGGATYQDVLVDCYELAPGSSSVPDHPTVHPFKVHTLYSPRSPNGSHKPQRRGARIVRPDPDYAQPSARYLKLITDGADEHDIPQEYKHYLHELRPYTITTRRQRIGAAIYNALWLRVVMPLFRLNRKFADNKGHVPAWLATITGAVFATMWLSYDNFFKHICGDGERTIDEDDNKSSPVKVKEKEKWEVTNENSLEEKAMTT